VTRAIVEKFQTYCPHTVQYLPRQPTRRRRNCGGTKAVKAKERERDLLYSILKKKTRERERLRGRAIMSSRKDVIDLTGDDGDGVMKDPNRDAPLHGEAEVEVLFTVPAAPSFRHRKCSIIASAVDPSCNRYLGCRVASIIEKQGISDGNNNNNNDKVVRHGRVVVDDDEDGSDDMLYQVMYDDSEERRYLTLEELQEGMRLYHNETAPIAQRRVTVSPNAMAAAVSKKDPIVSSTNNNTTDNLSCRRRFRNETDARPMEIGSSRNNIPKKKLTAARQLGAEPVASSLFAAAAPAVSHPDFMPDNSDNESVVEVDSSCWHKRSSRQKRSSSCLLLDHSDSGQKPAARHRPRHQSHSDALQALMYGNGSPDDDGCVRYEKSMQHKDPMDEYSSEDDVDELLVTESERRNRHKNTLEECLSRRLNDESDEEEEIEDEKPAPVVLMVDDYSHDEEGPEEENPSTLRRSGRQKYEDRNKQAWESDEDDLSSDTDRDMPFEITAYRPNACKNRAENMAQLPPPPVPATPHQQRQMLDGIEDEADKALQKLLMDEADFCFQLKQHQFEAVRKVAGVPEKFPLHKGSGVARNVTAEKALLGLDLKENKCTTRGILLADQMGLVSSLQVRE